MSGPPPGFRIVDLDRILVTKSVLAKWQAYCRSAVKLLSIRPEQVGDEYLIIGPNGAAVLAAHVGMIGGRQTVLTCPLERGEWVEAQGDA